MSLGLEKNGKSLAFPGGAGTQTSRRECCSAGAGTSRAWRRNPLEEINEARGKPYSFLFASPQQWFFTLAAATGCSFQFFSYSQNKAHRASYWQNLTGSQWVKKDGFQHLCQHHKQRKGGVRLELRQDLKTTHHLTGRIAINLRVPLFPNALTGNIFPIKESTVSHGLFSYLSFFRVIFFY